MSRISDLLVREPAPGTDICGLHSADVLQRESRGLLPRAGGQHRQVAQGQHRHSA